MGSFNSQKPLYSKVWKRRASGITGHDSVRACINNNKENFSIDVTFIPVEGHLSERPLPMLDVSKIEIELPNGSVWTGTIHDLQQLLTKVN